MRQMRLFKLITVSAYQTLINLIKIGTVSAMPVMMTSTEMVYRMSKSSKRGHDRIWPTVIMMVRLTALISVLQFPLEGSIMIMMA